MDDTLVRPSAKARNRFSSEAVPLGGYLPKRFSTRVNNHDCFCRNEYSILMNALVISDNEMAARAVIAGN